MFGVALGGSMLITLYFPTVNITSVAATEIGLRKGLSFGRVSGFSYQDPFLQGKNMPKTVVLKKDPKHGCSYRPADSTPMFMSLASLCPVRCNIPVPLARVSRN